MSPSQNSSEAVSSQNSQKSYLVKTTRYDHRGNKSQERTKLQVEEPREFSDHNESMKMLNSIRSQSTISDEAKEHLRSNKKNSGFLTQLMNPLNVSDLQTISTGPNRENIYINTLENQNAPKRRKKKIIVIKKVRHADGSVETIR